jgi:hypothetical protein
VAGVLLVYFRRGLSIASTGTNPAEKGVNRVLTIYQYFMPFVYNHRV